MSTISGKIKILNDAQTRINQTAAATVATAAQNKGTATDLLLTVIAGPDGASAVGGTTTITLQGANTSGFGTPTTVTPDKGTLNNITASGAQSVHAAQLQFQFYRLLLSGNATATLNLYTEYLFHPVEDSFDATVQ